MSTAMSGWLGQRLAPALLLGISLAGLPGCERDASGLTEWTPADHDHQVEPKRRHAAASPTPANPHAAPTQKNQVIDVTWQKQCATCHGKRGRGDGPSSPMVKARDLSNPEWQAGVNDEELVKVIKQGKDKMPAFNLPDSVIQGLVAHVRSLARKPKQRGPSQPEPEEETGDEGASDTEAAPASSAAPAPSAAPAGANAPGAGAPAPGGAGSASGASGTNVPAAAASPPADGAHGSGKTDTRAHPPTAAPAPKH
jgi:mono/diheme cytochrome c family protein